MNQSFRIAVAMSGGVDSSVAAALLKAEGHDVFGLMLRLWSPSEEVQNRCCSPADLALARRVASILDIPFYALDARELFKESVVTPFIDGYAQGVTPNPCLHCNRHIRWGFLLDRALAMGASHLATGHYARVVHDDGGYRLLRARDRNKDQSYILSILKQTQLAHTMFPLGSYLKTEVRKLAAEYQLPIADRGESQDLCFLGGMDYREFLDTHADHLPPSGLILDAHGNELGMHAGLAAYTIGQRKGINISAPDPYYVLEKDLQRNALIVGKREELGRDTFTVESCSWISGEPPEEPLEALTRIRYKAREVKSRLVPITPDRIRVELVENLPDVTPGQAAVFYEDESCLGSGIISA